MLFKSSMSKSKEYTLGWDREFRNRCTKGIRFRVVSLSISCNTHLWLKQFHLWHLVDLGDVHSQLLYQMTEIIDSLVMLAKRAHKIRMQEDFLLIYLLFTQKKKKNRRKRSMLQFHLISFWWNRPSLTQPKSQVINTILKTQPKELTKSHDFWSW